MDIKAALARAVAELEEAEAQAAAIQERVRELQAIRDGLQLAMDRYDPEVGDRTVSSEIDGTTTASEAAAETRAPLPGIPRANSETGELSQSDLSFAVVTAVGRPVETTEVRNLLNDAGWTFTQEQVRSALTYLFRSERIIRVAQGTWALPKPAAGSGAPALNGTGGSL